MGNECKIHWLPLLREYHKRVKYLLTWQLLATRFVLRLKSNYKEMKKIMYLGIASVLISSCEYGEDSEWAQYENYSGNEIEANNESYNLNGETVIENSFVNVSDEPISTFGLDPDGASYAKAKNLINSNTLPNEESVRIEEFINYFNFDYPEPAGLPVHVEGEIAKCPWNGEHKLLRIGLQGKDYKGFYPNSNYVFLIDVSGSMNGQMDLVKESLYLLIDQLGENDAVSIVTYAGDERVVCEGVSGSEKSILKSYANNLNSGGSTNGEAGITKAYDLAKKNFKVKGNNRVVLVTDGDFNVGVSNRDELKKLIKDKAKTGVYLSALGVNAYTDGQVNMQNLALHGNGTYDFIGSNEDAEKVFVEDYNKFFAVAKDVKIQVHFDPSRVKSYRLIGYENRLMSNEDFDNDSIDSGDLNSSQSITAVYELEMQGSIGKAVELKFKYKNLGSDVSQDLKVSVYDQNVDFQSASENFRFACGITGFGLLVKDSQYKGDLTLEDVKNMVGGALNYDPNGNRNELLKLIDKYSDLKNSLSGN